MGRFAMATKSAQHAAKALYFINAGSALKIGVATDPESRLRTLQTASPVRLGLVGVLPGYGWQERLWHWAFRHLRTSGEWFTFDLNLRDAVAAALRGDEWIAVLHPPGNPRASLDECVRWRNIVADREEIMEDRLFSAFPSPAFSRLLGGAGV